MFFSNRNIPSNTPPPQVVSGSACTVYLASGQHVYEAHLPLPGAGSLLERGKEGVLLPQAAEVWHGEGRACGVWGVGVGRGGDGQLGLPCTLSTANTPDRRSRCGTELVKGVGVYSRRSCVLARCGRGGWVG